MKDRIKQVRTTLGLTQTEFGKRLSIKQNTVAQIEGGRNTSDQTISTICREFNVNETWLRTGEGEMFVQRTVEDALGDLFDELAHDKPDAFRKRVFLGLAKLDPADWQMFERILKKVLDDTHNEEGPG